MTEFDSDETELEETFDDLKWTVTRASGSLLSEVAALEGNTIWDEIMRFTTEKLNSNQWIDQYVGMTCLGAVLSGPDQSVIFNQMEQSYQNIISMFNNSNFAKVRYATGWVINLLVKSLPELIFKSQQNLELLIQTTI